MNRARVVPLMLVFALTMGLGSAASAAKPKTPPKKAKTQITLEPSDFGKVLWDGKGGALYLFTADTGEESTCYGECAVEWPPFYARGRIAAGPGVNPKLIGRTTRTDGRRQVTYAGHPLYYWYRDPKNEILCHDVFEFGGDWLVVRKSGRPA
jgi:predicted lipoprotein with Yx(FWY)xxD motif